MLKAIGATTALSAFVLAALPALADSPGKGAGEQTTSEQVAHVEHHQQMHGADNQGMMGSGMMGHMMGGGMGHMSGCGADSCADEKDLSAADVKKIIEGRLAWSGNKRLKVGEVKKKDDDTYTADIVTVDNSLVERLEVDRKTGATQRTE